MPPAKKNDLPLPFIGVRMHENRTPTGRRTSTPAKRAALYFAYGNQRNVGDKQAELDSEQRGEWLGPDGRIQSHDQVMAWAKQEALGHRYTFEAILSVPQGQLTPEQFRQAMQAGDERADWRLIAPRDTKHSHAHVLFFRDKRLDKATFLSWQTDVRSELARLEQQQLNAQSSRQESGLEAAQAHVPELADMTNPTRALRSSKSWGAAL
jgi:hypothetical protein